MKKLLIVISVLLFIAVLGGCFGSSDKDKTTTTGTLKIGVTDAPLDGAEEVNIIFTKIEIKKGTDDSDGGWLTYFESTTGKAINLLDFRNGAVSLFDSKTFEAGDYGQVRVFLATTGNTIKINGEVFPLLYNSGIKNTGLKLVGGFTIKAGVESKLTIDFDVRQSIVEKGGKKGGYYLKPTARIVSNDISGSITVNASTIGALYYLYTAGSDVTSESALVTITLPDSTTASASFVNAVSSAESEIINGVPKAIFAFLPFGSYDVYEYDETEPTMLKTIATSAAISATNSSLTIE